MQDLLETISQQGRLFGALFYYPPQAPEITPFVDFFLEGQWQNQWQTPPETVAALLRQNTKADLPRQYQRLFIGPQDLPAPPWGSVYLDKEAVIFGDSLLALRDFLRRNAISVAAPEGEPEDHIGLMLMLCAYLAENRPELLAEFLQTHLLSWAPRQLSLLEAVVDCPFYAALGKLAKIALNQWQQQLNLSIKATFWYR